MGKKMSSEMELALRVLQREPLVRYNGGRWACVGHDLLADKIWGYVPDTADYFDTRTLIALERRGLAEAAQKDGMGKAIRYVVTEQGRSHTIPH